MMHQQITKCSQVCLPIKMLDNMPSRGVSHDIEGEKHLLNLINLGSEVFERTWFVKKSRLAMED